MNVCHARHSGEGGVRRNQGIRSTRQRDCREDRIEGTQAIYAGEQLEATHQLGFHDCQQRRKELSVVGPQRRCFRARCPTGPYMNKLLYYFCRRRRVHPAVRRSSSKPSAWISQWMRLSHGVDEHRCIEHYHLRRPLRSSSSSFSSGGSGTSIGSADKILRAAKARLSSPGGKARSTASRMSEATETPRALACSAIRS